MIKKYAGIFSAGHGTRLQNAFPGIIKPMVPINGKPLIGITVDLLVKAGINDITVLFNTKGGPAKEYLKSNYPGVNFVFLMKDTASSYESFRLVSQTLAASADHFLLTTVDSLYEPDELKNFLDYAKGVKALAILGITDNIADEKPLWVDLDPDGFIGTIGPKSETKKYATSGIYYISSILAGAMPKAEKYGALREYLADISDAGVSISSKLIKHAVDVDDEEDVKLATQFAKKYLN